MGKDSEISWTDHTFNPWWGCVKVSPACANCYAEAWARRTGHEVWGSRAGRRFFGDEHWEEPLRWNRDAAGANRRARVFCASMADVFEVKKSLDHQRDRLWRLIGETRWLDWLLLTKRPENVAAMAPWGDRWPANVWLGTTVETQEWAYRRMPHLLRAPAAVRFLSCEPLLGPLDLSHWEGRIDWIIAGGESGPGARPMHPNWARGLRDFCAARKIPFHFKQWGHWAPANMAPRSSAARKRAMLDDGSGVELVAVGKREAGRLLDGRTHDGFPMAVAA